MKIKDNNLIGYPIIIGLTRICIKLENSYYMAIT